VPETRVSVCRGCPVKEEPATVMKPGSVQSSQGRYHPPGGVHGPQSVTPASAGSLWLIT
jgi:hypothetical protein